METLPRLRRVIIFLAMATFCLVRTAPAGVQDQLTATSDEGKQEEAVKDIETLDGAAEAAETLSTGDKVREDAGGIQTVDGQEGIKNGVVEAAKNGGTDEVAADVTGGVTGDTTGESIVDVKHDVSDEAVAAGDDIITGSSSDPDATDYLWEPSFDYASTGDASRASDWFFYDLPYDPSQWSSNFEISDDQYLPYYQASYQTMEDNDDINMANIPALNVPVFQGVPVEELNNKVDQTVDEVLCSVLGLCSDVRVYPDDGQEWEEPNEIQFTEEGMVGNNLAGEKTPVQDIIDTKIADGIEKTKNDTKSEKDDASSSSPEQGVSSSLSSSRHRSKRDLSWDEPVDDNNDLLSKINELEQLQRGEEEEQGYAQKGLPVADRFEDLLEYFKAETTSRENEQDAEEYFGLPEPVLEELMAAAEELQEEEDEEAEGEEGLLEAGEFIDLQDEHDGANDVAEAEWGNYLVPGSPYIKDVLKYDGYKRDDEKEALKVYIESLQNLEGYRKRSNDLDTSDEDSRAAADFLRQLVPRSPPDGVRRPKTGLEPFAREKYFPFLRTPDGVEEDDTTADADAETVLKAYNELMDLYNAETEAAVLISTIQDMGSELGRDQRLLRELEKVEAENELQQELDADDQDILNFENSRLVKRAPRMVDYPDFNEYPPEYHRSAQRIPRYDEEDVSADELMTLYKEYLREEAEDTKWGEYINEPREKREDEDTLPGPHAGYYVQGRMVGELIKPKRDWNAPNAVDDLLEDLAMEADLERPYILLEPSDLGYEAWPGDFDIFYDTRDATYVLYPYPKPDDALSVLSDEALQDANGLPQRNIYVRNDDEEEQGDWGGFKNEIDLLGGNLNEINEELDQLEDLEALAEFAAKLKIEEAETDKEEELLRALLGNE